MKYTLNFRIWHWLNVIVVLGLLGTVFLRKTSLSYKTNAEIIMTKLSDVGVDIFKEDAVVIAKVIRGAMWQWHLILGYALAFLILYRVYLFFADKGKVEKFSVLTLHKKGARVSYFIFYISLILITLSGFAIYFNEKLHLGKEIIAQIKDIHEMFYYVILVFVVVHVVGVIISDVKDEHGIISTMINGKTKENF